MKLKTTILLLFIVAILGDARAQSPLEVEAKIKEWIGGINYWRFQYSAEDTSFGHEVAARDSIFAKNAQLMEYLQTTAPKVTGILKRKFELPDDVDMNIISTEDKKLTLFCWNTHTGSMVDFYNAVVLYETVTGIKALKIAEVASAGEMQKASGEYYNVLGVTNDKGERCYILLARLKMAEKDMLSIVAAYMVEGDQMKTAELFAGGTSSGKYITYMYDYMSNYDFEKMKEINTIHLSKNGKKLYIPELDGNQITGKWQVYNFDGSKFVYDKVE